jgi:hypothetical protein
VDVDNKYLINSKYGRSTMLGVPNSIVIYRVGNVFLRMAEAINRAGEPNIALAILKQGVSEIRPILEGGFTVVVPTDDFNAARVMGIHSRGSGNSAANERYVADYSDFDFSVEPDLTTLIKIDTIVVSKTQKRKIVRTGSYYGSEYANLASGFISVDSVVIEGKEWVTNKEERVRYRTDSIKYRYLSNGYLVDKVELMIVDEMALETAFEGHRFYDLMRVAMRREDPAFLADRVARRAGEEAGRDEALFNKLNDPTYDSWYLHKE